MYQSGLFVFQICTLLCQLFNSAVIDFRTSSSQTSQPQSCSASCLRLPLPRKRRNSAPHKHKIYCQFTSFFNNRVEVVQLDAVTLSCLQYWQPDKWVTITDVNVHPAHVNFLESLNLSVFTNLNRSYTDDKVVFLLGVIEKKTAALAGSYTLFPAEFCHSKDFLLPVASEGQREANLKHETKLSQLLLCKETDKHTTTCWRVTTAPVARMCKASVSFAYAAILLNV